MPNRREIISSDRLTNGAMQNRCERDQLVENASNTPPSEASCPAQPEGPSPVNAALERKPGLMEHAILSPIFWIVMIPMGLVIHLAVQGQNRVRNDRLMHGQASDTDTAILTIATILTIPVILVLPLVAGMVIGSRRGRNRAIGLPPGWKEPVLGSIGIIVICGNLLSYLIYALAGLMAQRAAWNGGLRRRELVRNVEAVKQERAAVEEQLRSAA